jgi:alanine dehydrogenase
MIIGIPKEVKNNENRVGATPDSVRAFCKSQHRVLVETFAGLGSGISDEEYQRAGARIVNSKAELYSEAEMILKVREPLPLEYELLRKDQILFAFILLERDPELTRILTHREVVAIAYEKVKTDDGLLPILASMSRIAGKMSVFIGAQYLQQTNGGRGILLASIPGVETPGVMILGGGTVGTSAAITAAALGAQVLVMEINQERIDYINNELPSSITAIRSNRDEIEENLKRADLLINAATLPADSRNHLVTKDMLRLMKKGSVIVDVSAEKNGAIETYEPRTHSDPTYQVDNVIHYCVQNMPGAVPKTATPALVSAVLPYALEIADKGWKRALRENNAILRGLCTAQGYLTHEETARTQKLEYHSPKMLVGI